MLSFFLVLGGRKQLRNDDTTEVRNLLFSYFWEQKFMWFRLQNLCGFVSNTYVDSSPKPHKFSNFFSIFVLTVSIFVLTCF